MRQTPQTNAPIHIGTACDRLAYADDVDICTTNIDSLEIPLTNFKAAGSRVGLKINESKTKIMK